MGSQYEYAIDKVCPPWFQVKLDLSLSPKVPAPTATPTTEEWLSPEPSGQERPEDYAYPASPRAKTQRRPSFHSEGSSLSDDSDYSEDGETSGESARKKPRLGRMTNKMASRIRALALQFSGGKATRITTFGRGRITIVIADEEDRRIHALINWGSNNAAGRSNAHKQTVQDPKKTEQSTRFRWWSDFELELFADYPISVESCQETDTVSRTVMLPGALVDHPALQSLFTSGQHQRLLMELGMLFNRLYEAALIPQDRSYYEENGFGRTRRQPKKFNEPLQPDHILDAFLREIDERSNRVAPTAPPAAAVSPPAIIAPELDFNWEDILATVPADGMMPPASLTEDYILFDDSPQYYAPQEDEWADGNLQLEGDLEEMFFPSGRY
jgi:hypothetical protein